MNHGFVVKVEAKKTVNPYNLNDILNRFDQQSPKDVNIKELHEEVKQHKKEIKELRQFISLGLSDLQDQINRIGNQEIHMDIPESSHVYIYIYIVRIFYIQKNICYNY